MDEMNVFYFCSDLYASIAAVSMLSLLENNHSFERIHFFIADDGIKKETKNLMIESISKFDADIIFIPLSNPSDLLAFPFEKPYQMGHSYPRMCIGRLLPQTVERLLILDSDTLILDDLGSLWNVDMGSNILAGVVDCMNLKKYKKRFLLEQEGEFYCNAGVFLVDLKKWREHKIENDIIEKIKEKKGNIFFFEQTLMNYCCRGRILKLSPSYNMYTLFYAFKYENLITWRHPTVFYDKKTVQEAIDSPVIIHFTRNFYMKSHPWRQDADHPLTEVYRQYMEKTPWKKLWKKNRTFKQNMCYRIWHLLPQKLLCRGANIVYNYIRPLMTWRNE